MHKIKGFDLSLLFRIIGDIGNSLYMLSDHILLLNKIGAYKFDPVFIGRIDVISNLLWGVECVSNLIYDIVDYLRNITELKNLNQSLKKIENKNSEEYLDLLRKKALLIFQQHRRLIDISRCVADLPVIVHFLTGDKIIPSYLGGFFGLLSSLIGAWQKFVK